MHEFQKLYEKRPRKECRVHRSARPVHIRGGRGEKAPTVCQFHPERQIPVSNRMSYPGLCSAVGIRIPIVFLLIIVKPVGPKPPPSRTVFRFFHVPELCEGPLTMNGSRGGARR